MLNVILYIGLLAEIVFFTYYERKVFRNFFSPIIILSYPILLVVSITFFSSTFMGYVAISSEFFLLVISGLLLFWTGSLLWGKIIPIAVIENISAHISEPSRELSKNFKSILLIAAWIIIGFLIFSFIKTYLQYNNVDAIGTEEFTKKFGGTGVVGHIMGLVMPLLLIFIGITKRRDYLFFITIVFLLLLAVLYQVKTWLYVPIIGGLLMRFFEVKKNKIKIIHIIVFILIIMLLFGLTYVFAMQDRKGVGFFVKVGLLFEHFMGYLYAGILGFSEHLKAGYPIGQNPKALFMPFINLYHVITGGYVEGVVSPYRVFIDQIEMVDVNVKTFFGTVLINGGYSIGIIYIIATSIILYFLWLIASISRNFWLIVLYAFIVSALALGWFDFYYNQLPFLEIPVYLILLFLISRFRKKKSIESSSSGQC